MAEVYVDLNCTAAEIDDSVLAYTNSNIAAARNEVDTTGYTDPTMDNLQKVAYIVDADHAILTLIEEEFPNKVTGSGTINTILKFTDTDTAGNSSITDDGTTVTIPKVIKTGDGGTTNYTEFESTGFQKYHGSAKYWRDIDFPIIIRTTGTGIPTLTTFNGNLTMPQWQVGDFNMCESQEFVHAWEEGSRCYWHIHLNTNGLDVDNRYVRFELEYGYTDTNSLWTFPVVVTTNDILIPANTPSKTQIIMSITDFLPTDTRIGGHAIARLKRIASIGNAPSAEPWIPMLQLHVLCDGNGSRNMTSK